jgi:D-sedoheptulose 7-phosphate isomerase
MRETQRSANHATSQTPLSDIGHVILDRDGVLNEEPASGGYITDPGDFRWLPGTLPALAALRAIGVRISVATNQSGVGRGLLSELALARVHDKMSTEAAMACGSIDAIYCCPHAPDSSCACRKPLPGLIERAIDYSEISKANTLVVGDAERDLEAASAAGARAALVRTGKGRWCESFAIARGIPIFDDLAQLAAELSRQRETSARTMAQLRIAFEEHVSVVREAIDDALPRLVDCIEIARRSLSQGGKLLACGNGGSAADAQHFVAELLGRFEASRQGLPAIALSGDPSTFTALSNDFGFDQLFARQVQALARAGDVLVALSTSGNSRNVLNAADAARAARAFVIALTGRSGGELARHADLTIKVPSDSVARIQEVHGICLHALAQGIDTVLLTSSTT